MSFFITQMLDNFKALDSNNVLLGVSQLLFVVEIVVDNLGLGGADEGAKGFEICLTYLLNRFKTI